MPRIPRLWLAIGLALVLCIQGFLLIKGGAGVYGQAAGAQGPQSVALVPEHDETAPDAPAQGFRIFIPSMGYDLVGNYGGQYGGGYYGASSGGGAVVLGTVGQAVQSFWWVALLALVVGTTLYDGWSRRAQRTAGLTPKA